MAHFSRLTDGYSEGFGEISIREGIRQIFWHDSEEIRFVLKHHTFTNADELSVFYACTFPSPVSRAGLSLKWLKMVFILLLSIGV